MKKTALLILILALAGCATPFFRATDGIHDSLGIYLPDDSSLKVQVIDYLSGSSTVVRDPSGIEYKFSFSATNDYFGVCHVREHRTAEIKVVPVSTNDVQEVSK